MRILERIDSKSSLALKVDFTSRGIPRCTVSRSFVSWPYSTCYFRTTNLRILKKVFSFKLSISATLVDFCFLLFPSQVRSQFSLKKVRTKRREEKYNFTLASAHDDAATDYAATEDEIAHRMFFTTLISPLLLPSIPPPYHFFRNCLRRRFCI